MNRSILRGFISLAIVIASLSALPAFASVCGDGTPDPGEECDDGNLINGDGCSSTCTIEAGFDCSAAIAGIFEENILVDGSFEDNNAGGEWTSINHSVLGPDQICGDACFGTPLAASADGSLTSGNYVLVAGGRFNTNSTGNVTHGPVSIPANAGTLEFQWATLSSGPAGDACTGASDGLTLTIGGTQVWSNLDGPVSCTNVNPYQRVVIDLATAPGGSYQGVTTDFEFTASATGIVDDLTNVMLDDVSIFIPLSPAIPPTPSACTAINCGDGLLGSTEACDDGNATSGDGCSATCQVEQPNFVCEDPIPPAPSGENISDGGLEKGSPNPGWAETGTRFEPICSEFLCGVALAKTGAFYAWFGGSDLPNDQTMTQNVQISVTATDLTFELRVGVCDSADDNLTVEIDGTEIYRYDCTAATGTYQTQTVPLGVFADGGVHALQFIGHTEATNGGNSNFNVDDISIQDNIALPWGKYGSCFELPTACRTPEQFNSGIPGDWTVINLGPDTADGWGASTDGICASRNWSPGTPDNNATGGGGPAACADSDATGQIDIDAGGAGAEQAMDTYLCSPPLDLTQVTDPQFSFLVNYQARDNDINDEELLQVLVGTDWPNGLTVGSYTNLGEVPDHLASTLELSEPAALRVDLSAFNAESSVHVCFHYRGTYAWYAQIDNAALRGSDCSAPDLDTDGDGVTDSSDNCPAISNPIQDNFDGDAEGDACDSDDDNDGQTDVDEIACDSDPLDAGSTAQDSDNDNVPDCVDTDDDNDQVADADDVCPATVVPESLPTRSLGVNRFALVDGDNVFDTKSPKGKGPRKSYTISDTAGCSCTQIVEAQGLGKGHTKFGCSISAMDDWVLLVNP